MTKHLMILIRTSSIVLFLYSQLSMVANAKLPDWSYDSGPSTRTKMGRELIQITLDIPNMPQISNQIMGRKQKFRPAFGPIPWRMRLEANSVKILFMGQDGTHIAEAAGRPATAGFGGRAQDFAKYFGVDEGAAFINAYSFTIKGQYGIYNTPYIYRKDDRPSLKMANLVSNKLWAMSNNLSSPVVKWRNSLIDWIIRNNKKSMKLIVLFGGAARDAVATYAKSKGAQVFGRFESQMKNIQVPLTKSEYAGGNNTFASLVDKKGKDLYSKMLGRKINYSGSKDQKKIIQSLKDNLLEYINNMAFTRGGPHENGLLNSAQLGGYNLDSMSINGIKTRSLKGLVLDDGSVIENNIIVISLPHPSSLSRTVMEAESYSEGRIAASKRVMRDVVKLNKFKEAGWVIEADPDNTNKYDEGEKYSYGRSDIGPEFYDFGTPANRMVSKSTARRMIGKPNVVIVGTRENGQFLLPTIKRMTDTVRPFGINPDNLYIARPIANVDRFKFDSGPGEKLAKIMTINLDMKSILAPKPAMSWKDNGIDAYNIKSHPSVSSFGHYRGKVTNPKIIIIADPQGYDDLLTAKALTGARGQYIQSLMDHFNINSNYFVLKTVPFAMDGASELEWKTVLSQTKTYRQKVIDEILKTSSKGPVLVIADGKYAKRVVKKIFNNRNFPIINIDRKQNAHDFGIKEAVNHISSLNIFKTIKKDFKVSMNVIPRRHLSFYARTWEGTSGDRVITSRGRKFKGLAFAFVVPAWAYKQKFSLQSDKDETGVSQLIEILRTNKLLLPYESVSRYFERIFE